MRYAVLEVAQDNPESGTLIANVEGAECIPRQGDRLVLAGASMMVEYIVRKVEHRASQLHGEAPAQYEYVAPLAFVEKIAQQFDSWPSLAKPPSAT